MEGPNCEWEWLGGLPWELVEDRCPEGQTCAQPAFNGTYVGEPAFTGCVPA